MLRRTLNLLPPIINAQGLSKRYGLAPLFEDISFTVSEGERMGLSGTNASGRSALLEILFGRVKPDQGGVAIRKGAKVSFVEQISRFAPETTCRSVIEGALERTGVPELECSFRAEEALAARVSRILKRMQRLCQAAGAKGWQLWRDWSRNRTFCCWTSLPITWILRESRGSKDCSRTRNSRAWWSATTATFSKMWPTIWSNSIAPTRKDFSA